MVKKDICENETINPFSWEYNFPPVYAHTSVAFLKRCRGFEEAKKGDMQAALNVVNMCVKQNRIDKLKDNHPDAVLLPVITDNRLPEAFAGQIGMIVHEGVRELDVLSRKTLSAMERLLYTPYFSGKINEGVNYIIVDDIVTQGGTVSALRKHVIANGGKAVAVTALALSTDSRIIAPDIQDVHSLTEKFTGSLLTTLLREYNVADNVWELTRAQVKYLLRFEKIESIINCMEKSGKNRNLCFRTLNDTDFLYAHDRRP